MALSEDERQRIIEDEKLRAEVRRQLRGREEARPSHNAGIAALLSLVIPGAGQMYKGQVGAGFAWLFFVFGGYCFLIVPGIILHLFCIFSAASGGRPGNWTPSIVWIVLCVLFGAAIIASMALPKLEKARSQALADHNRAGSR